MFKFMLKASPHIPNILQKEDQCTVILPQADRPELPHEVSFLKWRFQTTNCSERVTLLELHWKAMFGIS